MPPRAWRFRIADIRGSIKKILEATEGHDRSHFEADDVLVHAVLMHLIIIGEAASRLPPEVRELGQGIPWDQLRGMRNFLAHAYFAIDFDLIWRTVSDDLEPLLASLDALEKRLEDGAT